MTDIGHDMRQGTTPTHTFTDIPFSAKEIARARITYAQRGKTVVEKTEEDCKFDGGAIIVKLSQEETFKFNENAFVEIQVRIVTNDGESHVSDKITLTVGDALNKEVLT